MVTRKYCVKTGETEVPLWADYVSFDYGSGELIFYYKGKPIGWFKKWDAYWEER